MLHEALQIIHNNNNLNQRKQKQNAAKKVQNSTMNMTRSAPQLKTVGFGSSITVHKLRESKWFKFNEVKVFLSVAETGTVLERRDSPDEGQHLWGVALWQPGQEKSKNIDNISVYCLVGEKDKLKVAILKLEVFWTDQHEVRINNQHDKEKTPNSEDVIRKQIEYSLKNKSLKWHNNQHFVYFCRYEKPVAGRMQQISERVRWNSIGVNLGMLIRGRNRRPTTSK